MSSTKRLLTSVQFDKNTHSNDDINVYCYSCNHNYNNNEKVSNGLLNDSDILRAIEIRKLLKQTFIGSFFKPS